MEQRSYIDDKEIPAYIIKTFGNKYNQFQDENDPKRKKERKLLLKLYTYGILKESFKSLSLYVYVYIYIQCAPAKTCHSLI